jgi:hypothetical protein
LSTTARVAKGNLTVRNKEQRIALILSGLALLAMVAACGPQGTTPPTAAPEPTATSAAAPTPEPSPDAEQVRDAIVSALLALNTLPNGMDSTTVLADGSTHTTAVAFVPPDRKQIIADGTEIIVVGDSVYIKPAGTSEWQTDPTPATVYLGEAVTEQSIRATLGEVVYLGTDQFDGRPVRRYRYSSTVRSGEIELHSETDLWVGQTDGLPYRMVIDGETLAVSTDPATGESVVQAVKTQTTSIIAFDPLLEIAPPIP